LQSDWFKPDNVNQNLHDPEMKCASSFHLPRRYELCLCFEKTLQ
jgi:hypothetical protein